MPEIEAFELPKSPGIRASLTYVGACERCDWIGPERAHSLTALADFDAHICTPVVTDPDSSIVARAIVANDAP